MGWGVELGWGVVGWGVELGGELSWVGLTNWIRLGARLIRFGWVGRQIWFGVESRGSGWGSGREKRTC